MTRRNGSAAIEKPLVSARHLKGQAAIVRTAFSARTLRGQAAIEYLMTYGWAIAVLALIIGLIVSTGVLSPSNMIPEKCDLGPNFPCEFSVFTDAHDTKIILAITNGFSYDVGLADFKLSLDQRDFVLTDPTIAQFPQEIKTGDRLLINADIPGHITPSGSMKKISASLNYFSCEETINPECILNPDNVGNTHGISGKIFANIQKQE
ncbi:MAG: hypothetical protein ABII22_03300 [Candidatus Micrarchaeota archaeon]